MNDAPSTPWYHEGLQFSCTRCGRCCGGAPGYVWVSDDEIAEIARKLGMTPAEFQLKHTRLLGGRRSLLELPNGDCEFLERLPDGKSACRVHSARPLQCRTWPFWASNLRSRRAWQAAARDCPGMNQGEHHPLPVIQEAVAQARRRRLDL
ncbi:MAG: YkgJ family cysteine cluster protein [Planctomycetota bacterium]|nr:MAG: YkgJ family cysteine cluster protein [Planctomycetota bacterium]